MLLFVALCLMTLHVLIGATGTPIAWWLNQQALQDEEQFKTDEDEELLITAKLRTRSAQGILLTHVSYLVSGAIMLAGTLMLTSTDSEHGHFAFKMILLVFSARSLFIQCLMWWLAFASRRDRQKLLQIRSDRETQRIGRHRRASDKLGV